MLFGRVVRPPSPGAQLVSLDEDAAKKVPGVVAVVRDGSFIAVAAEREEQAIKARAALAKSAVWKESATLPPSGEALYDHMVKLGVPAQTMLDKTGSTAEPAKKLEARYTRPFQAHGSLGPSCAVAQWEEGKLRVWTHSQGVYPLRNDLANAFGARARGCALHARGRRGLLRAQRRGRRGARRGAARARHRRQAGQAAVDARRRVHVGTLRFRDGDEARCGARRAGQRRELVARGLEPPAQPATGAVQGLAYACRAPSRQAGRRGAGGRRAAAFGRRRPQRGSAATTSPTSRYPSTSSSMRRCALLRCARSAATPTCSRPSRSWTSSPRRLAPTRWSFACGT